MSNSDSTPIQPISGTVIPRLLALPPLLGYLNSVMSHIVM